jgi:hypothetical protein
VPSLPVDVHRVEIIEPVWCALRPARDFEHRARGEARCPCPVEQAVGMLRGSPVPAGCERCWDMLVDVLLQLFVTRAESFTAADDQPAYARAAAAAWVVELTRAANTALGGHAKPERRDGAVGRIAAALRASTAIDPTWSERLLTLVLRAVSARMPVPAEVWPHDRFAEAKAALTGRTDLARLRAEMPGDVRAVLDTIRQVAGQAWLDRYVYTPLRNREIAFGTGRIREPVTDERAAPFVEDSDEGATELREALWQALRSGDDPLAAAMAMLEKRDVVAHRRIVRRWLVGELADLVGSQCVDGSPLAADRVRETIARLLGPAVARSLPDDLVADIVGVRPAPQQVAA